MAVNNHIFVIDYRQMWALSPMSAFFILLLWKFRGLKDLEEFPTFVDKPQLEEGEMGKRMSINWIPSGLGRGDVHVREGLEGNLPIYLPPSVMLKFGNLMGTSVLTYGMAIGLARFYIAYISKYENFEKQ